MGARPSGASVSVTSNALSAAPTPNASPNNGKIGCGAYKVQNDSTVAARAMDKFLSMEGFAIRRRVCLM